MSRSLDALKKQLNWKIDDLILLLNAKEQEYVHLNNEIKKLNKKLTENYSNTKLINPDVEIIRLNYTLQIQEDVRKLSLSLNEAKEQEQHLQKKIQRLKTELKMIELYQAKKQQQLIKEETKAQEFALDEWVLQKTERA